MLGIVLQLHLFNVVLLLLSSTVSGVWGLILYFRKAEVINRFWKISLYVVASDGVLQALLGITLVLMGLKPDNGVGPYALHYVYGAIVAVAIPVAVTYSSKRVRLNILIFSLAALVIAAAAVRGAMTGLGIGS